ncbi:hypothetical protein, partial [Stutzerimonas azotifigens]|uniref:hypothetical protein n=1 Tax=Stutzerimonas azotifigens TaxID=291995 RepID=UPI001C613D0A
MTQARRAAAKGLELMEKRGYGMAPPKAINWMCRFFNPRLSGPVCKLSFIDQPSIRNMTQARRA